jgi:hypothetical protein
LTQLPVSFWIKTEGDQPSYYQFGRSVFGFVEVATLLSMLQDQ